MIAEQKQELRDLLKTFENKATFAQGVVSNFLKSKQALEEKVEESKKEQDLLNALAMVMDKFIDISNEETLMEIKDMINDGLKLAFPRTEFTIDLNYKVARGNQTIEFKVYKKGKLEDLKDAQSGGVLDLISFLLRVLIIHKMEYQKVIFLDEALNGISDRGGYSKKASSLIRMICEKKGFTVFLVTHKDCLSDNAHEVFFGEKIEDEVDYLEITRQE